MIEANVQEFLRAVDETPELWRSIDARVVALHKDGAWHNLVARFYLDPRLPAKVPRAHDLPRFGGFTVLQDVYPATHLPQLLAAIRTGTVEIQGHSVSFLGGYGDRRFLDPYEGSSDRIGRDISDTIRGIYRYGHSLTLTGETASELYAAFPRGENGLDAALRGLLDPWEGIGAVLLHALDEKSGISGQHSRRVSFVAPLQARLRPDDCLLADDVLTYTVEAASKTTGDNCVLVVTGIGTRGERLARRVALKRRRWVKADEGYEYTGTERLVGAKSLTLTLRLASFELGHTEVEASIDSLPLLLSAYHALFPGERNFASLLQPVRTEARTFEKQVALLFTYCGVPVEYIGEGSAKEAPDLLAQLPGTSVVLVIEITVGPLNQKAKLARLAERADLVKGGVGPAGGQVLPVVITANPRFKITQDELDAAKRDGIRVLALDDLGTLLRMASKRAPARHVASFLAPGMVSNLRLSRWALLGRHGYGTDDGYESS